MSFRSTLATAALVVLALPGFARAAEPALPISFADALAAASGDFSVPAAWAGVWDITDTTRECGGAVVGTDAGPDTLCTGDSVQPDGEGFPVQLSCTGTVNDFVVDIECTGTWFFPEDCMAVINVALDATRSGESYTATNTVSVTYGGTGLGCNSIPDFCQTTSTSGNRIGPEPAGCTTAIEPSTWGQVKATYR